MFQYQIDLCWNNRIANSTFFSGLKWHQEVVIPIIQSHFFNFHVCFFFIFGFSFSYCIFQMFHSILAQELFQKWKSLEVSPHLISEASRTPSPLRSNTLKASLSSLSGSLFSRYTFANWTNSLNSMYPLPKNGTQITLEDQLHFKAAILMQQRQHFSELRSQE